MFVAGMRRVRLVKKDKLNGIAFCGEVADKAGSMGREFYFLQISLLVDDQAIDVIVLIGGISDDDANHFLGVLFCCFHCL